MLPFPGSHHHLVIGDGQSLHMSFEVPLWGVFRQEVILAILLCLGERLAAKHLEEIPALPMFLTGLIEVFVVMPVSSAHFICSFCLCLPD